MPPLHLQDDFSPRPGRSEDALTLCEAMCRAGSLEWHPQSSRVMVSAGLRALLGPATSAVSPGDIAHLPWIAAEDRDSVAQAWRHARPDVPFDLHHHVVTADGERLWMHQHGQLIALPGSAEVVGIAVLQDVSTHWTTDAVNVPLAGDAGRSPRSPGPAALASTPTSHLNAVAPPPRPARELQLEAGLHQALASHELSLVYQPQVCLSSGGIVSAEALLRWRSTEFGDVSPAEFIPVAERSSLIAELGEWVIRQVCEQIVRWAAAGVPAIRVGLNISPVQFRLGDVANLVIHLLAQTGAPANQLGVEVTESSLLHDDDSVANSLRNLQAAGIEISLDDFGTGFSSLSRLRSLPIDVLKVDRSFVSDVTAAPESASVTRSIIHMAHGLKIRVLAEGVETEGQLNMLVACGCDRIQGFFFSKPVSADALATMLVARQQLPAHFTHSKARTRTLLLVDDEDNILSALRRLFRRDGYRILTARSGAEGLAVLADMSVDVIISDQRMPGMMGVDFLRHAKALCPDSIRMTLSGFTDLQSIIDAVNEGAVYKFLTKPWDDTRLREHVAQAFAQKEMADENRRLTHEVAGANADLAALNRRLEHLLARQREQAHLMEASAGGARALVDALPAAVFGLDPEGMLAYVNQRATEWVPTALASLGSNPDPDITRVLELLRASPAAKRETGHPVTIHQQPGMAWLRRMPDADVDRGEVLVWMPTP